MQWLQSISKEKFFEKYMINGEKCEEEVFQGVAEEIASVEKDKEKWTKIFYDLMINGYFFPAGRSLANARPYSKHKYYNNCFTTPIEDSISGIYDTVKNDALIGQSGGGNGINFSPIRPKGSPLKRGGEATGPVGFMKVINTSGKIIMTGGSRRSAHISLLNMSHPDIEQFITCKQGDNNNDLDQMNISSVVSDEFMRAVEKDEDFNLVFNDEVYKTVKARYLYDIFTKNGYHHNEPGAFFIDRVEADNNSWELELDATNPCGEVCLPSKGGVCNLGSLNLVKFITGTPFTKEATFDYTLFTEKIYTAVRFLDNVIDVSKFPLQSIEDMQKNWRRLGLGFFGLGSAMMMLEIKYGSKESLDFCDKLGQTLAYTSYNASIELAKEKGSFPKFDAKKMFAKDKSFVKKLPQDIQGNIKKYGLRNIAVLAIAPTGTLALTVGENETSGVEPAFSWEFNRTSLDKNQEKVTTKVSDYTWLLYQKQFGENAQKPDYFVTVQEIDPKQHIDVQAIIQKYIDHSISKTINIPKGYTYEQYQELFMYAWKSGLKGYTTFNPEGSMKGILEVIDDKPEHVERRIAPKRPTDLPCDIHRFTNEGKKYIVIMGLLNGTLYEMFVSDDDGTIDFNKHQHGIVRKIKAGRYDLIIDDKTCIENMGKLFGYKTLNRLISLNLRHGTPLQFIVDQLHRDTEFISYEKAVARILKKYIKEGEKVLSNHNCPQCGGDMVFKEGCKMCIDCGWSKCE